MILVETLMSNTIPQAEERKEIMLSFWKNGKEIFCHAIYGKGEVGQMVIYGERVSWEKTLDATTPPLSQYACPSIFTIVEKLEGEDGYYILRDVAGNLIKLQDRYCESSGEYLYDAQAWLTWNAMKNKEIDIRNEEEIAQLKMQVELLKDILVKQGIRIVTSEQATKLGLN